MNRIINMKMKMVTRFFVIDLCQFVTNTKDGETAVEKSIFDLATGLNMKTRHFKDI